MLNYFFIFKIIFIYFWLCWVFTAAWAFLQLWQVGLLQLWYSGSHCIGFSFCGTWAQWHADFTSCSSQALEQRRNSCGAQAQLLHSMWDFLGPGLKLMSPALVDSLYHQATRKAQETVFLKKGKSLIHIQKCSPHHICSIIKLVII